MSNKSEVAALLCQIEDEYEAGRAAMYSMAYGTARHDFISAKMDAAQAASARLIETIGKEQALPLIAAAMDGKPSA